MEDLKFNKEQHLYTLNDKPLISVTQLMQKLGLAPDYSRVNPDLLKKTAQYGTIVHEEIEHYIKYREIGITIELQEFIKYISKNKVEVLESEYMVHNDIVAGTIDLILSKNNKPIIADIKTTTQVHYDAVSWQLSIYLYLMLEMRANHGKWVKYDEFTGQCLHFTRDKELEVIEIPLKPETTVRELIESVRANNDYQIKPFSDYQLSEIEEAQTKLIQLEELRKALNEEMDGIKEELRCQMEKFGIKEWENDAMKITLVKESIRTSLDTKAIKEEHPRIYKKYLKETKVKSSVKITLRNKENSNE